jgi:hypothetical protein
MSYKLSINNNISKLVVIMKIPLKILLAFLVLILISHNSISIHAQDNNFIRMPFRYNEVWDTVVKEGRDDYGIHKDKIGVGIDFYTDQSREVLAPVSGTVSKGCVSKDVTSLTITRNDGQVFRLIHLLDSSIATSSGYINQGQVLGRIAPKGDYNGPNCNVSSDGFHVHMSIGTSNPNNCVFSIDGYRFECSGMKKCTSSQNGAYTLSFEVDCNRKYVNQYFVSTNGFGLNNDQCNNLINSDPIDQSSENLLNLQVCLNLKRLYDGVYSRTLDNYTRSMISRYKELYNPKPIVSPPPVVTPPKPVTPPIQTPKSVPSTPIAPPVVSSSLATVSQPIVTSSASTITSSISEPITSSSPAQSVSSSNPTANENSPKKPKNYYFGVFSVFLTVLYNWL